MRMNGGEANQPSVRNSEMDPTDTSRIRKRPMSEQSSTFPERAGEIDIASQATLGYPSETRITLSGT